ncbi:hypothetical protein [Silvanigrella aquatica]|uniref:Imelysin-like domain-containing protein n=1 Tax=Silvanigrella aquatica TaxID=1915309 RepID=A0A1L4CYP8_9BACT|nr:hypothetical protein [Silvanigrella aquatica]APJ03079.1 hypothetical protein AXG55_03805 [Silvanigrella aquatica]
MKRLITCKFAIGLNFIFLLSSCTSLNGSKENVSIVNTHNVPPTPTVIPQNNIKANETNDKEVKDIFLKTKEIEEQFITQNCTEVLVKAKSLEISSLKMPFNSFPPLAQAAIYICDARAGLDNKERVQKAISFLNGLKLRYPVINEAWLHNTLSDFYLAIGDKLNALVEKRTARDLILAQQIDISALNAQILQLNPLEPGLQQNSGIFNGGDPNSLNLEQIATNATQMLNNDSPEQAIALIDAVPHDKRNDTLKRIRSDAVNALVMNLRFKVRTLFVRSTQQTGAPRKETLTQCKQILEGIIKSYPEYSDMSAVQNNLKQVQRELAKP